MEEVSPRGKGKEEEEGEEELQQSVERLNRAFEECKEEVGDANDEVTLRRARERRDYVERTRKEVESKLYLQKYERAERKGMEGSSEEDIALVETQSLCSATHHVLVERRNGPGSHLPPGFFGVNRSHVQGNVDLTLNVTYMIGEGGATVCNVHGKVNVEALLTVQRNRFQGQAFEPCVRRVGESAPCTPLEMLASALSGMDAHVVGWPGFGKTNLCLQLLKDLLRQQGQEVVFYVDCRSGALSAGLQDILVRKVGLDADDARRICLQINNKDIQPVWLLDNFDVSLHDVGQFPGRRVCLHDSCAGLDREDIHFTLEPRPVKEDVGGDPLVRALSRIPALASTPKHLMAKWFGDDSWLVLACEHTKRSIWDWPCYEAFLRHHPVWVNWEYMHPERQTCSRDAILAHRYGVDGRPDAEERDDPLWSQCQRLLHGLEQRQGRQKRRLRLYLCLFAAWLVSCMGLLLGLSLGLGEVTSSFEGPLPTCWLVSSKLVPYSFETGRGIAIILGVILSNGSDVSAAVPYKVQAYGTLREANATLALYTLGNSYDYRLRSQNLPYEDVPPFEKLLLSSLPQVLLPTESAQISNDRASARTTGIVFLSIAGVCLLICPLLLRWTWKSGIQFLLAPACLPVPREDWARLEAAWQARQMEATD